MLAVFVLPTALGIAAIVVAAAIEVAEIAFWRRFLRRYRISAGAEALIGRPAEVVEACDPVGRVRLRGELWNARAEEPIGVGETVRVTRVEGLTLGVARDEG